MQFELPSLRESAIFKVCATLWNCWVDRRCFRYWKDTGPDTEAGRQWLTIEAEIKAKIPELGLPESLEKEVARFVKPLGGEILKWCKFHCHLYLDVNIDMPNEFCWTSRGTIDLKRTAEGLVRDENLNRATRYKLARFYCLENDILELCLDCRYNFRGRNRRAVERELVVYWNSLTALETIPPGVVEVEYVCAFLTAAHRGNIEAVKYFWKKLTVLEQNQSVFYAIRRVLPDPFSSRVFCVFPEEFQSVVLCFLLSQLNAEQQVDMVKEYSSHIALWFMDWPCESVVKEIVNLISDSLSPYACFCLLIEITNRVFEGHEYYDYPGLFTKVWLQVSKRCKQEVLRKFGGRVMIELLKIKDFENIRLILEDVDHVEKERFLYCGMNCFLLNADSFDLFIEKIFPLEKPIVEFKKKFEKLELPCSPDLFANLLDNFICEHGKRKCTEESYGNLLKKRYKRCSRVHNA